MVRAIPHECDAASAKFAIVVSQYHEAVTENLLSGAVGTLVDHQVIEDNISVAFVPGAWEIPLAAKILAETQEYAAIICLGAVIRGETTHDQHINAFVSQAIGQVSLQFNLPVSFGVLTCNTFQQAHDRAGGKVGNKGQEAALAALQMLGLSQNLQQQR